jgi:hypothetical protein
MKIKLMSQHQAFQLVGGPVARPVTSRAGRRVAWGGLLMIAVAAVSAETNLPSAPAAAAPRVFLLEAKQLAATRERIRAGDKSLAPALEALENSAKESLKARTVSVTDKQVVPPSGDKHDYMSLAPYFWPNPATSNGLPYIRRDGERNPEISKIPDHGNILSLPEKVETLALAYYFTGNEAYATKAAEFLRVWFLDPATRMNPHFQYAQAIRGVNTGRGIGLIESRGLTHVVDGVGLLAGAKSWTESDQRGLEQWFTDFLEWMQQSGNGRAEAAARNNHGTYYDIQVASFALFLGKRELATNILRAVGTRRIAVQIEPDGRQPLELARTKAWSYSTANLSGLMSLATLAEGVGVDLWNFEAPNGGSIRKALDYLLPFALGESKWPYQQLGGFSRNGLVPLLREAVLHYQDDRYATALARLESGNTASRRVLLRPAAKPPPGS